MSGEKRTKSGDHPAVKAYRKKMDSITENTMPLLYELNDRIDEAMKKAKTPIPLPLERTEPGEDDEIPVDVVRLPQVEKDPFPSKPPKKE
jgi:hypothetical protein